MNLVWRRFSQRNIAGGRLQFTTDLSAGVTAAEVIFLALPTPSTDDGSADLSYVLGVADELGALVQDYVVVVNKSTVPVGTAEKVRAAIGKTATSDFDVASNPEFLREGFAIDDFMAPDRIVIGTSSARARQTLEDLYQPFAREGNPINFMDEALRRDDQVRRQCIPGRQGDFYERNRQPL